MALSNKAYAMALNHVPDPPDTDPHCLAFKISKSESLIHKSTRADNTTTVIPSKQQLITTISVTDPDPSRFGSFTAFGSEIFLVDLNPTFTVKYLKVHLYLRGRYAYTQCFGSGSGWIHI
jgi:hypothetical protein